MSSCRGPKNRRLHLWVDDHKEQRKLAILQCVAMYGSSADKFANLAVLDTLKVKFQHAVIGYSDHTEGYRRAGSLRRGPPFWRFISRMISLANLEITGFPLPVMK